MVIKGEKKAKKNQRMLADAKNTSPAKYVML
jgi:hypothetical protein